MQRSAFVLALLVVAAAASTARAGDIYVWTDDAGKTHLADSVPPQYRKSAVRIDSSQFELSPEQQREAAANKAALEAKARAASAPVPATTPARKPQAAAPLRAPARTGTPSSRECEAMQREYADSLECFAPYVNTNGSVKPEAFRMCKSVVNPAQVCGSRPAY